jgi:hypothetical protein
MRTLAHTTRELSDALESDQGMTYASLRDTLQKAKASLDESLGVFSDTPGVDVAEARQMREFASQARNIQSICKNLFDAWRKGAEADAANEEQRKQLYRATLQESLFTLAEATATTDKILTAMCEAWGIRPQAGLRSSDEPMAVVKAAATPTADKHDEPGNSIAGAVPGDGRKTWVSLFNGKDLAGWVVDGGDGSRFRVQQGTLVADYSGKISYLLSNRSYKNFRFRLEFNADPGALRAVPGEKVPEPKGTHFDHPMFKICGAGNREVTGTLHWLRDYTNLPDRSAELNPVGAWNQLEMEVRGRSLKASVNGKKVIEIMVDEGARLRDGSVPALNRAEGPIGIQMRMGIIRYRNIEIMELPE